MPFKEGQSQPERTSQIDRDLERTITNTRKRWGDIFDEKNGDSIEATKEILSRITPALEKIFDADQREIIESSFKKCESTTNREDFVNLALLAIDPLIQFRKSNPKEFSKIVREVEHDYHEEEGSIILSEVCYCDIDEETGKVYIHLNMAKDLGIQKTGILFEEGLRKLAELIKDNKKIKEIVATSWIIEKNPKIIEKRFGFKLDPENPKTGKTDTAKMSKEQFLEKWLK